MIQNYSYTPEQLALSFDDLVRRHILGETAVSELLPALMEKKILSPDYKPSLQVAKEVSVVDGRIRQLEGQFEPWIQEILIKLVEHMLHLFATFHLVLN
jgi:hypothetical protein